MTTKHTQGEWMQFRGNIVTKSKSTLPIDYDTNICKLNNNLDESEANAKLIASAPDLLEALIDITNSYRTKVNMTEEHIIRNALSAIKKATN